MRSLGLWQDGLARCGKIVPTQTTKDLTKRDNLLTLSKELYKQCRPEAA